MSDKKVIGYILFIIAIGLLIFLAYLIKGTFIGTDSYYYLNIVFENVRAYGIEAILFSLVPKSIFTIKLILSLLITLDMLILTLIGILIFKNEIGLMAGILTLINPVFIYEGLKFEEEQFVYPIIFFAIYLFIWAITAKKHKVKHYLSLLIAAVLTYISIDFWVGINNISIGKVLWFAVLENMPLSISLTTSLALPISIAGYMTSRKLKSSFGRYRTLLVLMCIVGTLFPKVAMLSVPFITIGVLGFIDRTTEKYNDKKDIILKSIKCSILIVVLAYPILISHQTVRLSDYSATKYAIHLSEKTNAPLANDWGYGWLAIWLGGKPLFHSGGVTPVGDIRDYSDQNIVLLVRKKIYKPYQYNNWFCNINFESCQLGECDYVYFCEKNNKKTKKERCLVNLTYVSEYNKEKDVEKLCGNNTTEANSKRVIN